MLTLQRMALIQNIIAARLLCERSRITSMLAMAMVLSLTGCSTPYKAPAEPSPQEPILPANTTSFEADDNIPPPPNPDPAHPRSVTDGDGDAVVAGEDKCPNLAAHDKSRPGLEGCPSVDSDGDGLADVVDNCPQEAELPGTASPDGCPD